MIVVVAKVPDGNRIKLLQTAAGLRLRLDSYNNNNGSGGHCNDNDGNAIFLTYFSMTSHDLWSLFGAAACSKISAPGLERCGTARTEAPARRRRVRRARRDRRPVANCIPIRSPVFLMIEAKKNVLACDYIMNSST